VVAGPLAVVVAGEVALAAFDRGYPAGGEALRINRLSDVLRGVVGLDGAPQLALSAAVGLLGFGLLALVPLPPLDGYAAARLVLGADTPAGGNAERLGAFVLLALGAVPIGGTPPLLAALDVVGTPLLQLWA
jgi:hypothetical protein